MSYSRFSCEKFMMSVLNNLQFVIVSCMGLCKEAAKECKLFASVSEDFAQLPPVQSAFKVKFNLNDSERIKYYFNDNVNWIVFTINFDDGDKLCDWCYENLKQKFKNKNIIIEKIAGSIDIYSQVDKKYGQMVYRGFLELLKQDKSKETQDIIKSKIKQLIISNYKEYVKDVHESISEIVNKNFPNQSNHDCI